MVRAGTVITIEAPAKINLTLEVLGKRPDGYHELRSIVMPVSLADTLSLTTTYAQTAMTLTVDPGVDLSKIGSVDRNLAVRAGRAIDLNPTTGELLTKGITEEWITPKYRAGYSY